MSENGSQDSKIHQIRAASRVGNTITDEDRKRGQLKTFDLRDLDPLTRDVWLTYCSFRRTLAYFSFLHPEIGPLIRATEGRSVSTNPDLDMAPEYLDEEGRFKEHDTDDQTITE